MIRMPPCKQSLFNPWTKARDVLTLTEKPTPRPRPRTEVLVGCQYRGVNPSDVKSPARGRPAVDPSAVSIQVIPHSDAPDR